MGFLDFLSSDPVKLAEKYLREGDIARAAEAYGKAGEFKKALQIAVEAKDAPLATHFALLMVLGAVPSEYQDASASQAAELLFSSGKYHEALQLFEVAESWKRAAETAAKLQLTARAARLYERALLYPLAATYYKRANQIADTLRMLEREANRLRNDPRAKRELNSGDQATKIDQERAELLQQLGRHDEAAALVKSAPPTANSMRILEDAGRIEDAVQAYLRVGDHANALALLPKAKLDPIARARVLLECQRPIEAATAFVQAGDLPNAARAAQTGGETVRAARLWEQAQLYSEAAAAYRQARQWEDAARCANMAGDTLGAAEAFRAAGDHQRAGYAFLQAKRPLEAATCFLTLGDKQAATQSLRQVAGGTPDAARATILLAPLLFEQEQYSDGLLRLEMLPSLSGNDQKLEAERLLWQGQFLERLGRVEEALLAYRKVLILRPDDPLALARHESLKAAGFRTASTTAMRAAMAGPAVSHPAGSPPQAVVAFWEWPPGTVVAERYEIVSELGRGGMGRVYRARDREMGEEIAIKVVLGRAESSEEDRLRREVQITRRLTHPNIVRVFDLGRHDGALYVTMELVEGQRLDQFIAGLPGTSFERIREITSQIAAGLAVAHVAGVVHRDLKPGNIILTPLGVKILDFGIARPLDATTQLTQTGYSLGTPAYMSPEQVRGEPLDGRSDLYALGVVVFTLLCGREPFLADSPTAVALMHLQNPPPDVRGYRADAPEAWSLFVAKLLEKDPAARFALASDVARAVSSLPC